MINRIEVITNGSNDFFPFLTFLACAGRLLLLCRASSSLRHLMENQQGNSDQLGGSRGLIKMEVRLAACDLVRAACSKDIQLLDVFFYELYRYSLGCLLLDFFGYQLTPIGNMCLKLCSLSDPQGLLMEETLGPKKIIRLMAEILHWCRISAINSRIE